jgi:hypothetical protein
VRRDIDADLQNDLGVARERNRARIFPPALSAYERKNRRGGPERGEPMPVERLSPGPEEVADGDTRPSPHFDHPSRFADANGVRATAGDNPPERSAERPRHADSLSDDDDLTVSEDFHVHAEPTVERSSRQRMRPTGCPASTAAGAVRGMYRRPMPIGHGCTLGGGAPTTAARKADASSVNAPPASVVPAWRPPGASAVVPAPREPLRCRTRP